MKPQHENKSGLKTKKDWDFSSLIIAGLIVVPIFFLGYYADKEFNNIEIPVCTYYAPDTVAADTVVYHYVTMTVYHAVEAQTNSQPLVTASNRKIESAEKAYNHRYIALSRDLLYKFPYGTIVSVEGCGYLDGEYIVADTMNKRFTNYGDILINPNTKGGKWENVKITKIK